MFNLNSISHKLPNIQHPPNFPRKLSQQNKPEKKGPFKFQKIQAYAHMPSYQKKENQWNNQQIIKFAIFIVAFYSSLQRLEKQNKQKWKVFKKMSRFIKSRNPNQCRSYLIKILSKFKSLNQAITFYESNIKDLSYLIQRSRFQLKIIQEQQANQIDYSPINTLISKRQSIKSQNIILSQSKYQQKQKNQEIIPTASSYCQQQICHFQKPVNNYNNQNSFTNKNRYSFSKSSEPVQKKSIPSFDSFQQQQNFQLKNQNYFNEKQVKFQQKEQIGLNLSNQVIEQEFSKQQMNIQKFLTNLPGRLQNPLLKQYHYENNESNKEKSSEEVIQKRRQAFQQCHKYFQLWMGKLWKIMQQFPKQLSTNKPAELK